MYSVIIVDYNSVKETMEFIDRCIEFICEQEKLHFIVVDNYPQSEISQIIKKNIYQTLLVLESEWRGMKLFCTQYRNHQVHFLVAEENLGYAKGNNCGIAYSRERWGDEYVLVTNNDIFFPQKISLDSLKNIANKSNEIAIVGPHISDLNGTPQSPYKELGLGYMLFWSYFLVLMSKFFPFKIKNKSLDYDERSKKCYWVSGCFFLADSKKLENAGDFDDNTFLYAEEMILSERLKQKGYISYFCNDVEVVHLGSNTINKYFKDLEAEETIFKSYLHYFMKYKNKNAFIIDLARVHFKIIKLFFTLAQQINHIFKIRKRD